MHKRMLCVILAVLCAVSFAAAEDAAPFAFRNGVTFGMSQAEVMACEGEAPDDETETDLLYIDQTVAGELAAILYEFGDEGLLHVFVDFETEYTDPNKYLDAFTRVNDALIAQYGAPFADTHLFWQDPLNATEEALYGLAILRGKLSVMSAWDLETVRCSNMIAGDEHGLMIHAVMFSPPAAPSAQ